MALKQKCLIKQADKDRVANEITLKMCWDRLDNEYGNLETTIYDIFTSWRNLKSPVNDKQFVEFMNQIENGVACLQALDSMHELSASAVINIEEKLDLRMQKEISKLITTNTDPTKKRKDIVLTYLLEEKKATQLRVSNYSKGSFKQQEETSSHYSSTRGRGRGRGRGNSNRGRNDGSQPSRGNQRSSNKSSSCLLCGDNHFLPKCPKWMDLSTDKRFLLGFCKTNWICTHCLNTGHNWKNCSSQDAATCPCSSTYNMMVCCESEDCRLRKIGTRQATIQLLVYLLLNQTVPQLTVFELVLQFCQYKLSVVPLQVMVFEQCLTTVHRILLSVKGPPLSLASWVAGLLMFL